MTTDIKIGPVREGCTLLPVPGLGKALEDINEAVVNIDNKRVLDALWIGFAEQIPFSPVLLALPYSTYSVPCMLGVLHREIQKDLEEDSSDFMELTAEQEASIKMTRHMIIPDTGMQCRLIAKMSSGGLAILTNEGRMAGVSAYGLVRYRDPHKALECFEKALPPILQHIELNGPRLLELLINAKKN